MSTQNVIEFLQDTFGNQVVTEPKLRFACRKADLKITRAQLKPFMVSTTPIKCNFSIDGEIIEVDDDSVDPVKVAPKSDAEKARDKAAQEMLAKIKRNKKAEKNSETFKNPVYVVTAEDTCRVWGVCFSFDEAYKLAGSRVLHASPYQDPKSAKLDCDYAHEVRVFASNAVKLTAIISKQDLK